MIVKDTMIYLSNNIYWKIEDSKFPEIELGTKLSLQI